MLLAQVAVEPVYVDWDFMRHVLFALILLGRLGDVISTYLVTPNLHLEANPIARKLGWRFALLTVLICLVPYLVPHPLIAVILVPPFLMISANNVSKIWVVRAIGEKQMLASSLSAARSSSLRLAVTCTLVSAGFFALTGLALVWFSYQEAPRTQVAMIAEYFGYGIVTFAIAIGLHGSLYLRRIFRMAGVGATTSPVSEDSAP
ncbi:MAG: hypothetical protein ACYTG5_23090 [Planctomycetota bacterium]|jgi:hypothetical protein